MDREPIRPNKDTADDFAFISFRHAALRIGCAFAKFTL
jgi:hypothetical protein